MSEELDIIRLTISGRHGDGDYVAIDDAAEVWGHGETPALAVRNWLRELQRDCGWWAVHKPTASKELRRRMRRLEHLTRGRP
jgi:hypothetical protein